MPEIKYEVVDKIGIVSEGNNGWNKELNLISWNEREPVYDIRTWSPDHEKMGKGPSHRCTRWYWCSPSEIHRRLRFLPYRTVGTE